MASNYLTRLKAIDSLDLAAVHVVGEDLREALQRLAQLETESASSLELAEQVRVLSAQIERLKQKRDYARSQHEAALNAMALKLEQAQREACRYRFMFEAMSTAKRFSEGRIDSAEMHTEIGKAVDALRAGEECLPALKLDGASEDETREEA